MLTNFYKEMTSGLISSNISDNAALPARDKIYRGVCGIAKFAGYREKSRNFTFTATNREFSIIFASLFCDICIIITCATVFQVSLNSSHAIRPVVMNIRPNVTI